MVGRPTGDGRTQSRGRAHGCVAVRQRPTLDLGVATTVPKDIPLRDRAARYRLSDERAARLLELFDAMADPVDAEGHTDQVLELARGRDGTRMGATLRFTVGQEFGELEITDGDGRRTIATVYAAGPIERILTAVGFHEVTRSVVIARRYRFRGALVRIAHATGVGWSCEVLPPRPAELETVLRALVAAETSMITERDRAFRKHKTERRLLQRRCRERRVSPQPTGHDRRSIGDRRYGERRLAPTA